MRTREEPISGLPIRILLLAAIAVMPGCRGDFDPGDPGLVLELGISPTPPTVGPTRLIITLRDTAGAALEGAQVAAEGTMTHAGMVPVLDSALAQGPGQYVVSEFDFTMAGEWVLTLRATLPDGRWAQIRRRTDVVGAPAGMEGNSGSDHGGMHPPGGAP